MTSQLAWATLHVPQGNGNDHVNDDDSYDCDGDDVIGRNGFGDDNSCCCTPAAAIGNSWMCLDTSL